MQYVLLHEITVKQEISYSKVKKKDYIEHVSKLGCEENKDNI